MDAVESKDGYVLITVRVQPRSSRTALITEPDGRLRVALTAPPVEGAANKALCDYIAKYFGIPRSAVVLVKGEKSRDKTLRLAGASADQVRSCLAANQKGG